MADSPEYEVYTAAKQRCTNPKNANWKHYGGRGIKFLFKSFEDFYEAMGPRPSSSLTLERRNNDGNYELGNVYWATWHEQAINKRYLGRRVS